MADKSEKKSKKRDRKNKSEHILEAQYHRIKEKSDEKRRKLEKEKEANATTIPADAPATETPVEQPIVEHPEEKKKPHREKKRKEEKKQEEQEEETVETPAETPAAIEYLRQWYNDRPNWKFMKGRQIWLLKHIFDPKMIGKDDFKLFLAYSDGLQGHGRDILLEKARKLETEIVVTDKKDEKSVIERIQKKRAQAVLEHCAYGVCDKHEKNRSIFP